MKTPSSAIIVGANRGIGLAITKKLLDMEGLSAICATARDPQTAVALKEIDDPRLSCLSLDVTQPESVRAFASRINPPVDLVIHCAGILHEADLKPEKSLAQCHQDALARLFAVNSIGPLLVAQALLPLFPKREPGHFAVLSAMVGSIEDNRIGGWYGYRSSKAALNQFLKTLAIEARRTHPRLCVTAIHPGTTDTELSRPFQGNVKPEKLYTAEKSAERIVNVVLNGVPESSGRFVNWDGSTIPY